MSRAGIGDKLHVHRRYVSLHITRGQVGTSAPEMRKGLCCPNRSERVLRISFARKLSSTIASREREEIFRSFSRDFRTCAFYPLSIRISRSRRRAFVRSRSKEKKKEKREIFISACPRTTGNEYTGTKFCLHDLNFHSFDEMRADCKFFCEPLLRTKRRHG